MATLAEILRERIAAVEGFLRGELRRGRRRPIHLHDGARAYFLRPGKRLRPCLVMLSAAACGGDERVVLPAAAAVEVFHTWTLIHDDVIDGDAVRRGEPTVHELGKHWGKESLGLTEGAARRYGQDVAMLAGDLLQGWAVSLVLRCAEGGAVPMDVAVSQARKLALDVTSDVLRGELLDVQLSLRGPGEVGRGEIMEMMELKTARLLGYAAALGAALAIGADSPMDPRVTALENFGRRCGLAFQIQDDILGIAGDQEELGKPVGSDLRERKRTIILAAALKRARPRARSELTKLLARERPGRVEVERAVGIIRDCGALDAARRVADRYVRAAIRDLRVLPESDSTRTLERIAEFMTRRGH